MNDIESQLEDLQLQLAKRNRKINELINQDLQESFNKDLPINDLDNDGFSIQQS